MSKFNFEPEKELVPSSVKSSLVTWEEGARLIDAWFQAWWTEFEKNILPFLGNWRGWQGKRTAFRIFLKLWALAHMELLANLFPQRRKRKGLQQITTRNWQAREFRGGVEVGVFSGHPAWRRRRGRPSLSESAWIANYDKRRIERRKKNKTNIKHKDAKPTPTQAPPTQIPRPKRGEQFGRAPIPKSKPTEGEDSFYEKIGDEFKKELVKKCAERIGDFAKDKGEEYLNHFREMIGVAHEKAEGNFVDDMFDSIFGRGGED